MNVTLPKIGSVDMHVAAPPSKSYTHRAMIAGALASGRTTIRNPLDAQDTRLTLAALRALGVTAVWDCDRITIEGCNGAFPTVRETTLDLDNSGTSLRLLTSLALLCQHPVTLTGSARMQERPIGPLADALIPLGGSVRFLNQDGYPPLEVNGHLEGGPVTMDGSISSQFISSILIAAPYAKREIEVTLPKPAASASYLDITLDVMHAFGARAEREGYEKFTVSTRHHYTGREYAVEGDYSSASYFFALAAICGGRVTVKNLAPGSVQGDRRFQNALREMGCRVTCNDTSVTVERTGELQGITFDMRSSPDTVQTLCMVAATCNSPTTITGISHLKFKESDRINGTADRLLALGGDVTVGGDAITIRPAPLHGGTLDSGNDHRTAMSFAVLGLGIGGITITDAACVNKSFPGFWDCLKGVMP
ncbi:3-phosphoshikimate 1-carboxyvinyltransferase [Methanoregula sp.]|uniref:3-phosphoshikimate 1-carboxyvinyltransferase n=1 Tax=Methanoregula sp. TaxID=2052170 RepID=UPI00236CA131|nr:3-phosphoshikimate 1-carboxyvinyltransferase [Methanoregula sp.]MDD1686928.1 3-phosphoshikimate 1-carboxyvinyltransferase [Methanoregula sp.]